MRPFLAVAAALLLGSPVSAGQPYRHNSSAIVRVTCDVDEGTVIGTAVKIGPASYITAAHVVAHGTCTIGTDKITVTAIDPVRDYALFAGPQSDAFIPMSCDRYEDGRIYLARGYAGGGMSNVAVPWLATVLADGAEAMFIGDAIPGMSGGPLIDKRGRVVGIVNQRTASRSLPLSSTSLCNRAQA